MLLERLNVVLGWDGSQVEKGVKKTRGSFGKLEKSTFSLHKALGIMAGATGAAFAASKIFDLGAAVDETASKFRTTLGPETQRVTGFLNDFATMAGLSRQEGQDLTSTMAAVAQGMGASRKESADLAISTATLAGDLASFHNAAGGSAEVLRDMRSALVGEFEPMKKYGIVLNAAAVQQRALSMTGKESASDLTQLEKATASTTLMFERAGVAVGDLVRTQDSWANMKRRNVARLMNLRDGMANALVPALGEVLREIESSTGGLEGFADEMQRQAPVIAAWARVVIESAKFAADAFMAPLEIAFNLGEVIGHLARIMGHVLKRDFEAAKGAAADLASQWTDIKDVGSGLVKGLDDIRVAAGGAFGTIPEVARDADDLATSLDGVAVSAGSAATAIQRMSGMSVSAASPGGGIGLGPIDINYRALRQRLTGGGGGAGTSLADQIKQGLQGPLDNLKGLLDPSQIASDLATMGVTRAIEFASGIVGRGAELAFGDRAEEALRRNTEALRDNTDAIASGVRETSGTDLDRALTLLERYISAGGFPDGLEVVGEAANIKFLAELAQSFGLELTGNIESLKQLQEAIQDTVGGSLSRFDSGFDLLNQEFQLLDVSDPATKANRILEFMAGLAGGSFGEELRSLNADNIGDFLQGFLTDLRDGKDVFSMLGEMSLDQFLKGIGAAESALDDMASETERATSALRNAPSGFKIALERFNATQGVPASTAAVRAGGPSMAQAGGGMGNVVHVAGDVVLPGVRNPDDFLAELERSAKWRARTGARVIPVTTRRGG